VSKAHPVRRVADSPSLTPSVGLAVTCCEVRCPRHGSGSRSTTRRPLRSTGSGRARSPLRRYYEALRLLAARLASLRFLRSAIPSLRPRSVPPGGVSLPAMSESRSSRVSASNERRNGFHNEVQEVHEERTTAIIGNADSVGLSAFEFSCSSFPPCSMD
jgi:hypothetical protein